MKNPTKFLVVGATGHVGSKIAVLLADRGHDVTALVRSDGAAIRDPHHGVIRYVTGDLADEASMAKAVDGIDVVISTANGAIPQKKSDTARSVNDHALRFIAICENAGFKRFVQSSTPSYPGTEDLLVEAGGPQWLTWRQIADTIAVRTGRKKVRIIPLPARLIRLNQALAQPFSASAASVFALMGFVAEYQPRWESAETVRTLNLPRQWTVADYLDHNYRRTA